VLKGFTVAIELMAWSTRIAAVAASHRSKALRKASDEGEKVRAETMPK
jgi:hypothetical protein